MRAFCPRAFGRILWREAAEQYTLAISIFVMLVVAQASLTMMDTFGMNRMPTVAFGFGMALFMTAIYAAASSALLFAAEVDAGTFAFQRTRPVGWVTCLSGKLSWTVLSTIALGLAAWIGTSVWQSGFPDAHDTSLAFGVCGVGIVEGMAWGLIATIAVRGPLRAVIAGIAMASLSAWVLVGVHHSATDGGTVTVTTAYHQAAWLRLIVAAVVLAAGALLARVWYRTGQPLGEALLTRLPAGETDSVALAGQWSSFGQPCRGRSIRLLWQAWRQVRSPAVIYWGCCLAALILAALNYRARMDHAWDLDKLALGCIVGAAMAILGFSSLLAGHTFGADQKASFLQLARDGVSPWEIWLSRLAVMAVVLLPPALVVFGLLKRLMAQVFELALFEPLAVLLVVLGYFSTLVIGQACSMFVRSRVVALLAAPVVIGCFACWIGLSVFWAGLGWELGAAPLLLALLIGTRLLAGTRLRQDNSWRAMRVPVLLVVVAVVFSWQALAHRRAHEIQPYDSAHESDDLLIALNPDRVLPDTERLRESSRLETPPHEWIEGQLKQEDDTFLENRHSFAQPWQENTQAFLGPSNTDSVMTYRGMLGTEAALNQTLRRISAQSDIANERLRACVAFLEDWPEKRSRHADWLAAAYKRDLIWLHHGPVDEQYARYGFHHQPLPSRYRWFSFERKRMLKLLDRAYRIAAERADEYEKAVINDHVAVLPDGYGLVTEWDIVPYDPGRPIWYQASTHMQLYSSREIDFHLLDSVVWFDWRRWDNPLYNAEAQRRGTILYLALRIYYNDHEQLPESLDALVEGEYLDRLPVVPIACRQFYYQPNAPEGEQLAAIKSANDPDNRRSYRAQWHAPGLFEHDDAAPFLWYPYNAPEPMDPCSSPGRFIDLDFVGPQDVD